MKRLLSTALAVALLLGLGALAVLARGGGEILTPPDNSVAAAAQPQTVAATMTGNPKWNAIAMALDATTAIPDAEALSQQITGVQEVLRWDVTQQLFESWIPDAVFPPPGGFGVNFSTKLGEPYLLSLEAAPNVFSIVGNVPPKTGQLGALRFTLAGNPGLCKWNYISVPLDRDAITDAEQLSLAIGDSNDVEELLMWDAAQQLFVSWIPDVQFPPPGGFGTNFPVKTGYPYFVCMNTDGVLWP
jgi:hypothetical protein